MRWATKNKVCIPQNGKNSLCADVKSMTPKYYKEVCHLHREISIILNFSLRRKRHRYW